jgi:hypothetical protein
MNVQRGLLVLVTLAAVGGPALAQQAVPAGADAKAGAQASVPDFSGIWRHGSLPWLVPPASGPGPVTNKSRRKDNGTSNYDELVGDHANPILQPWASTIVKRYGELSRAGITFPSPSNQCWPEPVPYLFKHMAMQMVQLPDKVVMLFSEDHEVRYIRLNQSHPAGLKPSWHGDAVGHYEGDTLVVDTVGINPNRPYPMVDLFGTPYTKALHVVERYRLVDYATAKSELERGTKENWRPAGPPNPNYNDKYLQLHLTVEDEGAYTTPWTASIVYLRDRLEWPEIVCAENTHEYYNNKESDVPFATKADF